MKSVINNLKFAWKYTKGSRKLLIGYIINEILSIVISVVIPLIAAKQIIYLTDNSFKQLLLTAILVFGIEIGRNTIKYISNFYNMNMYKNIVKALQHDLANEVLTLDNKTLDKNGSGIFIQRLTSDTSELSDAFGVLTGWLGELFANIGVFVAVFVINKVLFLYFLVITIFLFLIENTRTRVLNKNKKEIKKKREKITGFASELVRGARDIKMLNSEKPFIKKVDEYLDTYHDFRYKMYRKNRLYIFFRGSIRDLMDMMFIVLSIILIINNYLTVPNAIIIYYYKSNITQIINTLSFLIEYCKDFNLATERIKEVIDGDTFTKETFGTKHINKVNGDFEFKNVTFAYDDNIEVLKDLSFKVDANTTVGFVGKSGAGKSTIFQLLCKMYPINKGKITIDGIDINELDKDSIRGNITIISQDPYIFNLSIKDNLKLVKSNITNKEMKEVCKAACLDDFINTLPDKYDTIIGEGGVNLSGGQKQRLAIARALLQKTEIILFDEATSALDNETQSQIREAIKNLKGEYTILIIAHRFSTVLDSDKIYVIDDGKIIGSGTHKELYKNNKLYRTLYKEELKGEK